uniref:MCF.2 cell line derived transforming sequence like n=1 Tax=Labrus bergylta TaxID=56723 RepID=A0A3Q3FVY0_9LABR
RSVLQMSILCQNSWGGGSALRDRDDEIMQLDSSPLRAADIIPDLKKQFAFLSGGRGDNGSPIIVFPEFPAFGEITDGEFHNVLTYLTSVPSKGRRAGGCRGCRGRLMAKENLELLYRSSFYRLHQLKIKSSIVKRKAVEDTVQAEGETSCMFSVVHFQAFVFSEDSPSLHKLSQTLLQCVIV